MTLRRGRGELGCRGGPQAACSAPQAGGVAVEQEAYSGRRPTPAEVWLVTLQRILALSLSLEHFGERHLKGLVSTISSTKPGLRASCPGLDTPPECSKPPFSNSNLELHKTFMVKTVHNDTECTPQFLVRWTTNPITLANMLTTTDPAHDVGSCHSTRLGVPGLVKQTGSWLRLRITLKSEERGLSQAFLSPKVSAHFLSTRSPSPAFCTRKCTKIFLALGTWGRAQKKAPCLQVCRKRPQRNQL